MPEDDEYISAAAAGEILGVSPRQAMRYGAGDDIRRRVEGRKFFYHTGDVQALAAKHQGRRQRVTDATSHMSRPNEWRTKYEEANEKVIAAARAIGQLEQQVAQLQAEVAQRPSADAYAELETRYQQLLQLQQEAEPPKAPATPNAWWQFWKR
jgi:hypothetical protein